MALYEQRAIDELDTYQDHIMAMTVEGLVSKTSIAAELAWRDEVIETYKAKFEELAALSMQKK